MAKQFKVARREAVGCAFPRVLQQVTAVTRVAGGWCSFPWLEGSRSSKGNHTLEMEMSYKTHRSHTFADSSKRRHRGALHLQSKVCQAAVWLAATPARGMATASLTWETVLSEENKASLKARLAKLKSPMKLDSRPAAAVLVPLCHVEGELSLLYTLRCLSLTAHAGQVSFPGGMADPEDRDEVHTALRETHEEIGLRTEGNVEVLGMLPPLPSRTEGASVVGVLAYVGHLDPDALTLSPHEVEAVIVASLKNLCHPDFFRQTQFRSSQVRRGYTIPVFVGTEPRVWGLTAIVTHMALTALLPGLYNHRLRHIAPLQL